MVQREIAPHILKLARMYPAVLYAGRGIPSDHAPSFIHSENAAASILRAL
jgi:hypothetical protein